MGLRAALRGLVSMHDEGRLEQPATFCHNNNNDRLLSPYDNSKTPLAKMGHDTRTGVHLGQARVYKIRAESSSGIRPVSPPASAARSTTLTDSSVMYRTGTNTLHTENRYTLAEMAARVAFTDRCGYCGSRTRVVSIPPGPSTKDKPVVIVKRKPLPSQSKSVQGSRAPSPLRSAITTDEPHSDPSSCLTREGAERSRSAAQSTHVSTPPTPGHNDLSRRVADWASNTASHTTLIEEPLDTISEEASGDLHQRVAHWASNTASHATLIEEPLDTISEEASGDLHHRVANWASNTASHATFIDEPLDIVSEEASGATMVSPVCRPIKRRGKGRKRNTVATSHLARGSMRSEAEHVDAT
ncbi:uncharacterized protein LY79DRAFT_559499 [Colletotrichum navitas]|uniref:Uncharacterized protein n=1 Tax=Colletotrichum navitas TaxID=681940 RepID=A0AAD8V2L7_9PEZI|nr:uncharacterized protein LY79DRAFT_559499 [Colletotrichum navitas]KAK1585007.1 hypothetical protein LY79DRAFT_559499 [Colletotrichum navitas]